MATASKKTLIAKLTPNAEVVIVDGKEVRVAANKIENTTLNMIMISQGRNLIQNSMKSWADKDETPSPKELKDIISAMKELADASGAIYGDAEPLNERKSTVSQDGQVGEAIDFSAIKPAEKTEA